VETLHPAQPSDAADVAALLAACGLAGEGAPADLQHFTVAREGGRLVGVIGLEVVGTDGLMRSLAVAPEQQGRGIARRLYASLLAQASRLGLRRLYVLSTGTPGFLAMLGFRSVPPEAVPEGIRATTAYRNLPPGGTCLSRAMPRP
jgi:amino-acid N-acetyltransferase